MKPKKKVLVIATSSYTRGGITAVIKAHQASIFWQKWNCIWVETHIDKSIFTKLFYFVKSIIKYFFLIKNTSLIHCHLSGPISSLRKLPFLLFSKLLRKPIIVHFHAGIPDSSFDKKYRSLYAMIFGFADSVIVLSKNWKLRICEDLSITESKVKIIPNPCPNIERDNSLDSKKIILYAGTLYEKKGYGDLITAFSKIANNCPDWKIVFAGNGEIEEGKTLAKKLNIYDKVIFKGWVLGQEKHKLFSQASIFCLPSYAEGFPMAVLDAWAYELPVVSTPVGGIPDIAINGENMLLCDPGNINCLAKNLKLLIDDNKIRKKLTKASIDLSKGKFSIDSISNSWDSLYADLSN